MIIDMTKTEAEMALMECENFLILPGEDEEDRIGLMGDCVSRETLMAKFGRGDYKQMIMDHSPNRKRDLAHLEAWRIAGTKQGRTK